MTETFVHTNGVELCTESIGDAADETILMIHGATASMIQWPDGFCHLLADGDRHVIRYDNRDTGRSTSYPTGEPGYDLYDMAGDAIAILDDYGIDVAHILGMSLGGFIAQLVALDHPDRIKTMTLISTSPQGPDEADLSSIEPAVFDHFMGAAELDWSNIDAVSVFRLEAARLLVGSAHEFDADFIRDQIERDIQRTVNLSSQSVNHALVDMGPRYRERLGSLSVPTLVIHGTDDPIMHFDHAEALLTEIPGATLLTLEGVGHELPPQEWRTMTDAILEHTARQRR